jgi:hypothetical protein
MNCALCIFAFLSLGRKLFIYQKIWGDVMQAKKGQWVQISDTVLDVGERASQVPDDTKAVPLVMWVKGYLCADAELGASCSVITPTGREVTGKLEEIEPGYTHAFGEYVPELDIVRWQVREMLSGVKILDDLSIKGGAGA